MTERESAKYVATHEGECTSVHCDECFNQGKCHEGDAGALRDAKQWLADHPEKPTETDYRKMCRLIIENDGNCPAGRDGFPACSPSTCELCSDNCYPEELKKRAQAWLYDHPEHSAEPERYNKGSTRGDTTYSLSLSAGRLSLYRWHGKDSESMDFGGTIEDFNQFDDERPEEWFDVAAKMIAGRK